MTNKKVSKSKLKQLVGGRRGGRGNSAGISGTSTYSGRNGGSSTNVTFNGGGSATSFNRGHSFSKPPQGGGGSSSGGSSGSNRAKSGKGSSF